jgi:hypothetical protein
LLLAQIAEDFVFEGPRLALNLLCRVEPGVLAEKQLDGLRVLVETQQHTAKLALLLVPQLSISPRFLHRTSILLNTSRLLEAS